MRGDNLSVVSVQIPLAKGKDNSKEALRQFYKLMATDEPTATVPRQTSIITILDLFLDYSEKHTKKKTYTWYKGFLQPFTDRYGAMPVESLKPFHITRWLDAHPDWKTARRAAIVCVKRALNWAVDEGLLDKNPIKGIKNPPMPRRERILSDEEKQLISDNASDQAFKDLLLALRESGARPGEIASVTAENVNLQHSVWVLTEHKTKKKTQKPRIIYLTAPLLELTKKLMSRHPTGPLFRDSKNNAWNSNSIRLRFQRIREKLALGNDVVAYLYRHGFATDAMENGVPVASVAELLGHTNIRMVQDHYSHLAEKRKHLSEMAKKATERKAD